MAFADSSNIVINRTVVPSNTTDVTISGLDGQEDRFYKLYYAIFNPVALSEFNLRFNGADPGGNGNTIKTVSNGTTVVSSTIVGLFELASLATSNFVNGELVFQSYLYGASLGNTRLGSAMSTQGQGAGPNITYSYSFFGNTNNITSLTVHSTVANGIGAGSEIVLCKV